MKVAEKSSMPDKLDERPNKAREALGSAVQKLKSGGIASYISEGLTIWIINFVVIEILISGGRYEYNLYISIVSIVIAFFITLFVNLKKPVSDIVNALSRGLSVAISYGIMDYLVVNLLLEKNSLMIYRSWGYLAVYGTILILPVLIKFVANFMDSRKSQVLTNP